MSNIIPSKIKHLGGYSTIIVGSFLTLKDRATGID